MPRVTSLVFRPLSIELDAPFSIATGEQRMAQNVAVHVLLDDGCVGLGEAAPFPAVNGETQEMALSALERVAPEVVGRRAEAWRSNGYELSESLATVPSALCAVETALLDALCRSHSLPMQTLFGGGAPSVETDITLPTGSVERICADTEAATKRGFKRLKVKVGGCAFDLDVARLRAVVDLAPNSALLLDANASLTPEEAIALVRALGAKASHVAVFEQPTCAEDVDALRAVHDALGVPIAADESARSVADVARIGRARAAQIINLKLTKSGLVAAVDMAATARGLGMKLMVGGMVESTITMTTSACLAAALGAEHVDLDTPFFMKNSPVEGGFRASGPQLLLSHIKGGHGASLDREH